MGNNLFQSNWLFFQEDIRNMCDWPTLRRHLKIGKGRHIIMTVIFVTIVSYLLYAGHLQLYSWNEQSFLDVKCWDCVVHIV